MKKKILTAAVAAMITLTTGVVMANPVEIDGSASFRYRADEVNGAKDKNGITKIILNAKSEIDPNFSVYARLGVEGLRNEGFGKDFNKAGTFVAEVDQYGVVYKNAGFNYKVGRQDLFFGTGLLFDNTGDVGKNKFLDGLTVTGKSGVTDLQVVTVQTDSVGPDNAKLYGIHAAYNPAKNLTLGGAFAQVKDAGEKVNVWAVDAKYIDGKVTYAADYAKSDVNTDDQAYSVGASYAVDAKNTVWVTAYKVEDNATFATTYEPNAKGVYYGLDHSFTKDTALHLFYRDAKQVVGTDKNTSFRATVSYNF